MNLSYAQKHSSHFCPKKPKGAMLRIDLSSLDCWCDAR